MDYVKRDMRKTRERIFLTIPNIRKFTELANIIFPTIAKIKKCWKKRTFSVSRIDGVTDIKKIMYIINDIYIF